VAAVSIFLLCLLAGLAAGPVVRRLLQPEASGVLRLSLRSGPRSMRIGNLTTAMWQDCVVTVEGGWRSAPFALDAGEVTRVAYDTFLAGASSEGQRPAFAQAFHQASVRCHDGNGRWHDAAVE
jgi:hypothetical protein